MVNLSLDIYRAVYESCPDSCIMVYGIDGSPEVRELGPAKRVGISITQAQILEDKFGIPETGGIWLQIRRSIYKVCET
jgi:hypothetical protein